MKGVIFTGICAKIAYFSKIHTEKKRLPVRSIEQRSRKNITPCFRQPYANLFVPLKTAAQLHANQATNTVRNVEHLRYNLVDILPHVKSTIVRACRYTNVRMLFVENLFCCATFCLELN